MLKIFYLVAELCNLYNRFLLKNSKIPLIYYYNTKLGI